MPELSPAKIGNNRENEVYLTKYLNVKSKIKIFFFGKYWNIFEGIINFNYTCLQSLKFFKMILPFPAQIQQLFWFLLIKKVDFSNVKKARNHEEAKND